MGYTNFPWVGVPGRQPLWTENARIEPRLCFLPRRTQSACRHPAHRPGRPQGQSGDLEVESVQPATQTPHTAAPRGGQRLRHWLLNPPPGVSTARWLSCPPVGGRSLKYPDVNFLPDDTINTDGLLLIQETRIVMRINCCLRGDVKKNMPHCWLQPKCCSYINWLQLAAECGGCSQWILMSPLIKRSFGLKMLINDGLLFTTMAFQYSLFIMLR